MRGIKFRAWDKRGKAMYMAVDAIFEDAYMFDFFETGWELVRVTANSKRVVCGQQDAAGNLQSSRDDGVLMEYTGLKDKNGVEIYEGDIIEKTQYSRPFSQSKKSCRVRYAVKWDEQVHADNGWNNDLLAKDPSLFNRRPGFIGKEVWNEKGYDHHSWSEFADCEVIGNIYENPELLEAAA